jgi:hypothetical protein
MKFTRVITKEGLKTTGGGIIPSPFIFEGEVTALTIDKHGATWGGVFKSSNQEEDALVIKGSSNHPRSGYLASVSFISEDVCNCSEDNLSHTINMVKLLKEVDRTLANKLGCEVADIKGE